MLPSSINPSPFRSLSGGHSHGFQRGSCTCKGECETTDALTCMAIMGMKQHVQVIVNLDSNLRNNHAMIEAMEQP